MSFSYFKTKHRPELKSRLLTTDVKIRLSWKTRCLFYSASHTNNDSILIASITFPDFEATIEVSMYILGCQKNLDFQVVAGVSPCFVATMWILTPLVAVRRKALSMTLRTYVATVPNL